MSAGTSHGIWIVLMSLLWAGACTSAGSDAPPGSRFVVLGVALARDPQTGLEWTRRDGGVGLDWHKAEAYCQSLSIDDTRGWRLPGIEELRRLYGATTRIPCGDAMCAIDPAFTLGSQYVWSASAPHGPSARTYLDFQFGTELTPTLTPRLVRSVLCVRTSVLGGR
jgi:hypothetical protein